MYLCQHFIFSHGRCCSKWWHAVFLSSALFFHFGMGCLVTNTNRGLTILQTVLFFNAVSFFLKLCFYRVLYLVCFNTQISHEVLGVIWKAMICFSSSPQSFLCPQDQDESMPTPPASAQPSAAEGNSGGSMPDIFSTMLKDTTSEHRTHLFDLNCLICTGKWHTEV